MAFAYLLLLLIPVFAVVYIVWDHRRKTAQRDAANTQRLEGMLGVATHTSRLPQAQTAAPAGAMPAARSATPSVSYVRRNRLLSPPQTLLYYLLRRGLPDHLVFAQMTLASVLDTAPAVADHARSEMARRLADHGVDFVIADKRMQPVAVLKLIATDGSRNELSSMQRWVAEAGIRYVELDAHALPPKESIRAVVLGEGVGVQSEQGSVVVAG